MTHDEAIALATRIRMDLTNAQAKLTDVLEHLRSLPAEAKSDRTCPVCGLILRGPLSLAEHLHTSHDGPLPEHWLRAEQLAAS